MTRRLVVTVCLRERGAVVLPVERGQRARRLDARAVLDELARLVARRGLGDRVRVREACAGGCGGPGPNVDVRIYAATPPGQPADQVAVGWKTYVYSLPALDCLAAVIEQSLDDRPVPARARRAGR
jgi:hypothetical protein